MYAVNFFKYSIKNECFQQMCTNIITVKRKL